MKKLTIVIFCLLINLFSYGQEIKTDSINRESLKADSIGNAEENEPVYLIVEDMPHFNNKGGLDSFREFIANNLRYPEEAVNKGIQGTVYVQFIINKQGKLTNAKIVRGVHESLDNEALRVMNLSPYWRPGIQRGKLVNVQYTIPISFLMVGRHKKHKKNKS